MVLFAMRVVWCIRERPNPFSTVCNIIAYHIYINIFGCKYINISRNKKIFIEKFGYLKYYFYFCTQNEVIMNCTANNRKALYDSLALYNFRDFPTFL